MRIKSVKIKNFRNLDGIVINFDLLNNYIVGDNNLGKSNFLELLRTIFTYNAFKEEDFYNVDESIEIEIALFLSNVESGVFKDLIDPKKSNFINISVFQESIEDNIIYKHKETGIIIANALIRRANYIYYNSLKIPYNELNFDRNRGVGRFLCHLVSKYFESKNIDEFQFIDSNKINDLLKYINSNIQNVKTFNDFQINADIDNDSKNVLSKVIMLCDSNNFSLQNVGCGIQFFSLVTLTILERILNMNRTKLEKYIIKDNDGNKNMSIILGLDEPEVHLHPYMQRTMIKYFLKIIDNKDEKFRNLLKNIFDLDKFIGQIIVSTHSPNIILNDYKNIIRFYKNSENKLVVRNGIDINLENNIEKHLLAQFQYIKEAFFAKLVMVVEGDSELSTMPEFADKMGIDLDEFGISIIRASGATSIVPIMRLLKEFGITAIGLVDRDEKKRVNIEDEENLFVTEGENFEEDIVDSLISVNKETVLKELLIEYDSEGIDREMQLGALKKYKKKYKMDIEVTGSLRFNEFDENNLKLLKLMYLTWLNINKNTVLGRMIGRIFPKELIPNIYKEIINKSKELLSNNAY